MPTDFTDTFSKEIYEQTYKFGNEDINGTHRRVASDIASIEKDKEYWEKEFLWALESFKFVPGGRITSNAGTGLIGTSYINCFVSGPTGEDQDSMESILSELQRQALILKSEGGYGFCADFMRPRGGFIKGIGSESPGAVRMLDMWDTQSSVITSGSGKKITKKGSKQKIRKGAQMVTMSCWHPDIEEFITAKQTPGKLTKFNMSVLITDDFMEAVQNKKPWYLEFPDHEEYPEEYKKNWNGNIKQWKELGFKTKIHKSFEDANEMWDIIMKSTYNRNEPGVLFVDTMNKMNNLHYNEFINATNPCLTGDTIILTDSGHKTINELVGKKFNAIVDGKVYESTDKGFWSNGIKPVYEIEMKNGMTVKATENHRFMTEEGWMEVKDMVEMKTKLKIAVNDTNDIMGEGTYGEGYFIGQLIGDGTFTTNKQGKTQPVISIWTNEPTKYGPMKQIQDWTMTLETRSDFKGFSEVKRKNNGSKVSEYRIKTAAYIRIAEKYGVKKGDKKLYENGSKEFTKGMIQGLFDADGCPQFTGGASIRLNQSNLKLLKTLQLLLLRFGITSTIYLRRKEMVRMLPDGNGLKESKCKANYELCITRSDIMKYMTEIGFLDEHKSDKINKIIEGYVNGLTDSPRSGVIKSITNIGEYEVFDCTIPDVSMFSAQGTVSHNCGEQILPIGGVCLLGSVNLTTFINEKGDNWDYKKLERLIPIAVRFMDNINDITYVPLKEQRDNLKNKRRIGLGLMGYGSALMMMKTRYGSKRALELTEELMKFFSNTVYLSSIELAKEKGPFPLFDKEKYLVGNYIKNLSNETREKIEQFGIRNSHLLSIQPTGNSSVYANNISGGLEPIFLTEYTRTTVMPYTPEGLYLPKNVDWINKKFDCNGTKWEWKTEGDENLLFTIFNDFVWKFERSRGLLRETIVKDYSVRYLESKGEWDPTAEYAGTTMNLKINDHVDTMKIFAKYVDSAISKTTNIPADYPYQEFKELYMDAYKTGTIKGITTYRAGTMATVLSETNKDKKKSSPQRILDRPESLDCDIHVMKVKGVTWVVLVGLMNNSPFELFSFKQKNIHFTNKLKKGKLIKRKKGRKNIYDLSTEVFTIENIRQHFDSDEEVALTRMISVSLRYGADINTIYDQLQKSEGTISSFSKAIARTLSKYVTEVSDGLCEECNDPKGLMFQEGCMKCKNCGWSKCL